jgi:hypothetical protein
VSIATCSDYTLSLSSFSGNVALTLHCPGDIIQPSLWNNRYTCLEYQLWQPVSHEYFNVIYDHIDLAYNALTYFLNNVLSLTSTQQAQVTPYLNQLTYVINNVTKKYAMDLVRASDWNALTNALYAIDQILQFIKQNWIIPASIIVLPPAIMATTALSPLVTVTPAIVVATVSSSAGWQEQ